MRLYLARHGEAASVEVDPRKGLSDAGRGGVARVAAFLGPMGLSPRIIWHSGKARAEQTAAALSEALARRVVPAERPGLAPNDDPAPFVAKLPAGDSMVVGHLPFLERLATRLITGEAEPPACRFRNGWVVALEPRPSGGGWWITRIIGDDEAETP